MIRTFLLSVVLVAMFTPEAPALESLPFVVGHAMETGKLCGLSTDSLYRVSLDVLSKQQNKTDWIDSWGKGMNAAQETFRRVDDCPKARVEISRWEMALRGTKNVVSENAFLIKKRKEIAQACFQQHTSVGDQHYCLYDATQKIRQNDLEHIGFTYFTFVIDGRAEEITSNNFKHPLRAPFHGYSPRQMPSGRRTLSRRPRNARAPKDRKDEGAWRR
jgi:hypothetical protein